MVTRERLHELIDELPEQQTEEAARLLEQLQHREDATDDQGDDRMSRLPTAAEIRAQAGISASPVGTPLSQFDRFVGKIFPEDESAEEFDATIRRWRTEGGRGRLPD